MSDNIDHVLLASLNQSISLEEAKLKVDYPLNYMDLKSDTKSAYKYSPRNENNGDTSGTTCHTAGRRTKSMPKAED